MLERIEEGWITVLKSSATETERIHERGCENSGVSCVTIAQETFERGEEFEGQRARNFFVTDESGLVVVQVLYYANDWVCDPII